MLETLQTAKSKYFIFTWDMIVPVLIVLSVGVVWYLSFRTPLFAITDIVCLLDYQPCGESAHAAEVERLRGQNILSADTNAVYQRLTSGDFTIREVVFRKELPHRLRVEMQSVYPVAALQIAGGTEWAVLDDKNRYIGIRTVDPNVPVVLVPALPPVQIGSSVTDKQIVDAIAAAQVITSNLSGVKSVSLTGDTLAMTLNSGIQALFSIENDLHEQIRTLQVILSDTTMVKEVEVVDVRFSRPVIK